MAEKEGLNRNGAERLISKGSVYLCRYYRIEGASPIYLLYIHSLRNTLIQKRVSLYLMSDLMGNC